MGLLGLGATKEARSTNLSDLLKNGKVGPNGGWPKSLADEFVKHWRVVSHQPNMLSGFSATVFEALDENGAPSGKFVFANRGTEPVVFDAGIGALSDLKTDVFDLSINGLAWNPIIAMYNYLKNIFVPRTSQKPASVLALQAL